MGTRTAFPSVALLAGACIACSSKPASTAPPAPPCTTAGPCTSLGAGASEDDLQAAFASAAPGQTILLGAGTFAVSNTLIVASDGVTVRGVGIDQTILDFSGQKAGSEGLFAQGVKSLTFEGFTIRDTKGNAVKVLGSDGLTFRNVKAEWTGDDPTAHGGYGLYPVQSKNVLIDGCVATGASDSGIYVGQSDGVVVRESEAYGNVAGIEIENTFDAEVALNHAHDNTGGILVFDLPGLPQKGGHAVLVHDNVIENNNTDNFAPQGNVVGLVPRGTGFLVMANHDVEAYGNTFKNDLTVEAAVVSYFVTEQPIKDDQYYPYPARVHLHDNTFEGGGSLPDARNRLGVLLASAMDAFPGHAVPAILWDGIVDDKRAGGTAANRMELCLRNNRSGSFANLHFDQLDEKNPNLPKIATFDASPHDCELPSIAPPSVSGK